MLCLSEHLQFVEHVQSSVVNSESPSRIELQAHSHNQERLRRFRWQQDAARHGSRAGHRRSRSDGPSGIQRPPPKVARKRAKSAYDVFRFDMFENQKGQGHRVNITGCAFRTELKQAWEDVKSDDDRLQRFRDQAALENLQGPSDRQELAVAPIARVEQRVVGARVPSDLSLAASQQWPDVLERVGNIDYGKATWPVSVDCIRAFLEKKCVNGERVGPSFQTLQEEYRASQSHYAHAAPLTNEQKQLRPPPPPSWLPTPLGAEVRRGVLENALKAFVIAAIAPLKAKDLALAKLLVKLQAEIVDDELDIPLILLFSADGGNSQAGAIPFRSFFTECGEIEDVGHAGRTVLQMKRFPYQRTRRELPFGGGVDTGMFMHYSQADVAAFVLSCGRAGIPDLRVTLSKQRHRHLRGDCFVVDGLDDTFAPHVVDLNVSMEEGVAPRKPPGEEKTLEIDWDSGVLPSTRSRGSSTRNPTSTPRERRLADMPERIDFLEDPPGLFEELMMSGGGYDLIDPEDDEHDEDSDDFDGEATTTDKVKKANDEPPPTASTATPSTATASTATASTATAATASTAAASTTTTSTATTAFSHPASSTGGSSSSSAGPPAQVAAENCSQTLQHVRTVKEVQELLPDFFTNIGWEVRQRSLNKKLGKIRCIQGSSLRIDCFCHPGATPRCKLHLDIQGKYEQCQVWLHLWAVQGTTCTGAEHIVLAKRLFAQWKAYGSVA
jgi:hypothetical protein